MCCLPFTVREPADLDHANQLVDAGNREVEQRLDVFTIQPGAVLEDLAEGTTMVLQPAGKCARRVEFDRLERPRAGRRHPSRLRGEPRTERIAKRVRRIGRHCEYSEASRGFSDGSRRRARRFADAAFTAVKNEKGRRAEAGGSKRSGALIFRGRTRSFRCPRR